MGVPVRVWPRAPKKFMKFHFTFDKYKKSQKLRKQLLSIYKNFSPLKADYIIVAGGDGYMLRILKKYYYYKKPFYGINCGSYGFLMNPYITRKLENKIFKAKKNVINPLELISTDKKNVKKKLFAINDVSLFRQSKQTASISLRISKKIIIKKLIGDGVLISTPAGSTAYNLSIHGPILSLNSEKIAITPISPFRPRRWRGKVVSNKHVIKVTNLDITKRPVAAVADNVEIRNIKSLMIKTNKNIKINLLYNSNRSLFKKILIEQIRKNTK
jgi:NAD+ kinase